MEPTTPEVAGAMETHAVAASGSRELATSTAAATPARKSYIKVDAFVILIFKSLGNLLYIKFVFSSCSARTLRRYKWTQM